MDSIPSLQFPNSQSQVPSSWSSLSCPSEPSDIGNWFSSYEYRSPGPDSILSVEDSAFAETETQRDGGEEDVRVQREGVAGENVAQCKGTCVNEDDHNGDQRLNKNLEPFSSCTLLSEPPDIRNWFSSYVYESPESDTSNIFGDEISEENECGKEKFDFEVVEEDESRSENVLPEGCVEHKNSSNKNIKGDDNAEMKKNSTTHLEKVLEPCMQDKLQHNLGPTKYKEILKPNHKSRGFDPEGHLMSETKDEIQHDKKLDMSASVCKTFSGRSSTCRSNKENDGFVTTRRNSFNRGNDEKILLTNAGAVPMACEEQGIRKRKALTEATNVQQYNHDVLGITGEWQCPQKRKPDVGPAMKQLRLERWLRRV